MRSGILLLVALALALAALAALLWWRFRGSGKPAAPTVTATRNHHSLRSFHYEPAGAAPKVAVANDSAEAGSALARLLPQEDLAAPEPGQPNEAVATTAGADSPELTTEAETEASPAALAGEESRPASIRHAASAVASLLDTLDDIPVPITQAPQAAPEPDEEPAEALFHNPITAPAPTANDQANRAAEIALRQQRRARMSTDAAAQRTALTELFPGAGSPAPTAKLT